MIPLALLVFGLIFGSFLNVVIHRLPRRLSLVRPRSHCPSCGRFLGIIDLIPLFGYLLTRGRCQCGASIHWHYPTVELLSGLMPVVLWWLNLPLVHGFSLFVLLLAGAIIDLEHMVLPNLLTVPGAVFGFLLALANISAITWQESLIGFLLGAGTLLLLAVATRGMGMGDVKQAGMMGSFLGPLGVITGFFLACVIGALVGGGLLLTRRIKRGQPIPFGPFLGIGGVCVLLWPELTRLFWPW